MPDPSPATSAEAARQRALASLRAHADGLWRTLHPDTGPAPTRSQVQLTRHYVSYTETPPQITLDGVMRWAMPHPEPGWWGVAEAPVRVPPDGAPLLRPRSILPDVSPDPWAGLREAALRDRLGLLLEGPVGARAHLRLCEPLAIQPHPATEGFEALLCLWLAWPGGRPRRGRVFLRVRLHPEGDLRAFSLCSGRAGREALFESIDAAFLPRTPGTLRLSSAAAVVGALPTGSIGLRPLERGLVTLSSDSDLVAYVAQAEGDWRRVVTLIPHAHLADGARALTYLRAWAAAFSQAVLPERHLPAELRLSGAHLLDRESLQTEDDFRDALLREVFCTPDEVLPLPLPLSLSPQSGGS